MALSSKAKHSSPGIAHLGIYPKKGVPVCELPLRKVHQSVICPKWETIPNFHQQWNKGKNIFIFRQVNTIWRREQLTAIARKNPKSIILTERSRHIGGRSIRFPFIQSLKISKINLWC